MLGFFLFKTMIIIGSSVYMDVQFASFKLTCYIRYKNVQEFPAVNSANEDHANCLSFLFTCMDFIQFI